MELRDHWNDVYATKTDQQVSWFEPLPAISLELLASSGVNAASRVLDVGGGDSRLVDALVAQGVSGIAVLDVSGAALARAKSRLGPNAKCVTWIESDVTASWSLSPVDVWHDRAVFHFLTDDHNRARYRDQLHRVLKSGGVAIIATFASDGPEKCSGLPVARYSAETLAAELGAAMRLIESRPHMHITPWGSTQSFQYSRFVKQ